MQCVNSRTTMRHDGMNELTFRSSTWTLRVILGSTTRRWCFVQEIGPSNGGASFGTCPHTISCTYFQPRSSRRTPIVSHRSRRKIVETFWKRRKDLTILCWCYFSFAVVWTNVLFFLTVRLTSFLRTPFRKILSAILLTLTFHRLRLRKNGSFQTLMKIEPRRGMIPLLMWTVTPLSHSHQK